MTAALVSALIAALTSIESLILPLGIAAAATVFVVLLVTSVRPVRRAPARLRVPRVVVAIPGPALLAADSAPVLVAAEVREDERRSA
ncbi:MAG: hypothetical protein JWP66_821 [Naasia sp.]|nr:hypothetical protein [Naasia sp.]